LILPSRKWKRANDAAASPELLYPSRPADAKVQNAIETTAGEQAIMMTWQGEVNWRR